MSLDRTATAGDDSGLLSKQSTSQMSRRESSLKNKLFNAVFVVIALVAIVLYICFFIYHANRKKSDSDFLVKSPPGDTETYRFASVAGDDGLCSEIGTTTLARGGSAVDSAISSLICSNVLHMQNAGIGGGFHMVIWDTNKQSHHTLDAQEVAPLSIDENISNQNIPLSHGPNSIAIPGSVAGMWAAHQKFGRLGWSSLFQPTIDLCRKGFKVPSLLAKSLSHFEEYVLKNSTEDYYKIWRNRFINLQTGQVFKVGETIHCLVLAATLEKVAENGADEFYTGNLAKDIVADLNEVGSSITSEDLSGYKPIWRSPLVTKFKNGIKMISTRPPGSGVLLSHIMHSLEAFNFTSDDINKPLTYHRLIEAIRFGDSKKISLGDVDFIPAAKIIEFSDLIEKLTSPAFGESTRSQINDNFTHPPFLNDSSNVNIQLDSDGVAISVLAGDGSAVAVTSTSSAIFGSGVIGSRSGIVFNNEMGKFSPKEAQSVNAAEPGKRPYSSTCPAIFLFNNSTTNKTRVRLVLATAGGSIITAASAQVASRVLMFDLNIKQAVESMRFYQDSKSSILVYEENTPEQLLEYLKRKGHTELHLSDLKQRSFVQAVELLDNGRIIGASDKRNNASYADGY